MKRGRFYLLINTLALALCASLSSATYAEDSPVIAIIIDDMGYRLDDGRSALALPGDISFAFLPHTPHARNLARDAAGRGREILVHLPMEATGHNHLLGPGALTLDMDRSQFRRTLESSLDSVPGAVGVNNHMGSLLTQYADHMSWLMQSLAERKLYFLDSRTSSDSVAGRIARERDLPSLSRDVFLDNIHDVDYIRKQFGKLVETAHRKGHAVGIAHPHAVTLDVLRLELARLDEHGVKLMSLSELLPDAALHRTASTRINHTARQ